MPRTGRRAALAAVDQRPGGQPDAEVAGHRTTRGPGGTSGGGQARRLHAGYVAAPGRETTRDVADEVELPGVVVGVGADGDIGPAAALGCRRRPARSLVHRQNGGTTCRAFPGRRTNERWLLRKLRSQEARTD